jgi:hypothetical protein
VVLIVGLLREVALVSVVPAAWSPGQIVDYATITEIVALSTIVRRE